jgi:hypothetical protein
MSEDTLDGTEAFIETVEVGGDVILKREGTFQELSCSSSEPRLLAAQVKANGAKVDDVIKVAKFAWDIIKDSNAVAESTNTTTRILSAKDENWFNYAQARNIECQLVRYKLDNIVGTNCFDIRFRLGGTCGARHETIGGLWIPNAHITFDKCSATWPWIVEGSVAIDAENISNMGTVNDPIPQVVVIVKIKAKAKFALNWESHERTFEFTLNAETGAKPVAK